MFYLENPHFFYKTNFSMWVFSKKKRDRRVFYTCILLVMKFVKVESGKKRVLEDFDPNKESIYKQEINQKVDDILNDRIQIPVSETDYQNPDILNQMIDFMKRKKNPGKFEVQF